jgi:hypothetical protein
MWMGAWEYDQISAGESEILELKRTTGQLSPAGKALCAFLNGQGGKVVIGAGDTGKLVGQIVSDKTRRELAMMLDRFEPPAPIDVDYMDIPSESTIGVEKGAERPERDLLGQSARARTAMVSDCASRKTPRIQALTDESPTGDADGAFCEPNCALVSTDRIWLPFVDVIRTLCLDPNSKGIKLFQAVRKGGPGPGLIQQECTP